MHHNTPTTRPYTPTRAMGNTKLISNSFRDANRTCECVRININLRDLHCELDLNYCGRAGRCCKSKIGRPTLRPRVTVILIHLLRGLTDRLRLLERKRPTAQSFLCTIDLVSRYTVQFCNITKCCTKLVINQFLTESVTDHLRQQNI